MKLHYTLIVSLMLVTAMLSAQAPRTVLLELTESTWDVNTAEVICLKEEIKASFPDDVAVITYHIDNVISGGDPLFNSTANNWSDAMGINSLSRGIIDRVSFNGTNLTSLTTDRWIDTIASRLNRTSVGLVTMPEVLFDEVTRELYVRVQIDFQKEVIELADYRFFCFITRNGLTADQLVDTNASLCATLTPDSTDTVFGYSHSNVAIANPGSATGVDNVIPVEVNEGDRFTRSFTFVLPANISLDDIEVVGFVADWGGQTNVTKNRVVNTAKASEFTGYDSSDETDPNHPLNPNNPNSVNNPSYWPTAIEKVYDDEYFKVYPNPIDELGIVEFNIPSTQFVSVDLYTLEGKLVRNIYAQQLMGGSQKAAITAYDITPGVYMLRIKGESFQRYFRIIKQ